MFRRVASLPLVLAVVSCATNQHSHLDLVQVPLIVGALKCAFATALIEEQKPGHHIHLYNSVASGTLTLKLVNTTTKAFSLKGQAAAGGPFVFALAGGTASILPSFSSSVVQTDTITTDIDFRYLMFARDTHVCDHIDTKTRAVYGFSTWLAGIIEGLDKNADADPQGQPDDIKYSSDFAVVKDNKLGVDFNVVFLSGSASAENNRNDVQSIKFTIAPQSKDNPPPDVYDRFK